MEQTFNLLELIKFLRQTLVFTEDVKNVLILNCDEAMFCLKPWYMKILSQPETSKDICTCPKFKTEVEEISASISRTLLQTQQLREKLSFNVTKEKNSKCLNMYEYSQKSGNKEQRKVRNLSSINKSTNAVHLNQGHNVTKLSIRKINSDKGIHNEITKNNVFISKKTKSNNKQLITHSENKNFLAINKRNIKNIAPVKQYKNIHHKLEHNSTLNSCIMKSKCINFDEKHSTASTSELKNLIQKISSKPNNYLTNECTVKCTLHKDEAFQCISEQNLIAINVLDSLNIANIPEEIIKLLKVYHIYTNIFENLFNGKRQKMFNKFLIELNKNGQILQEKLTHKNYIIITLPKFTSLFKILFYKNPEIFNLSDIKTSYAELTSTWKMYKLEECNTQAFKNIVQKMLCATSNIPKWMSNEIWNFFNTKHFEGISEIYCTRYTNKNQLLFFHVIEKMQYIQYYKGLIKIVIEDVLPNVKMLFNPTQLEYVKLYKMISILHQDLNPKIPVLVKTDK
ncbi:hypothetical protein ANTRET_LOCUS2153 [Anthophora retusa]